MIDPKPETSLNREFYHVKSKCSFTDVTLRNNYSPNKAGKWILLLSTVTLGSFPLMCKQCVLK